MSKAFSTSPLIAAALTGPPGARPQLPHLLPPPPLVSGGPPMQRPHMNQGQSEPSALSQLTAFASRGPITSASSAASPLHLPPPHSSSPYNTYSPSQQPPPPLIHGPPPPGAPDADDQEYTLTPLEPFGGKPLKPTLVSSADGPFPPTSHSTDSGSRLLNLDSGPPRHLHPGGPPMGYPHVMPYERFPSHLYGPKHGPPPPTGHPSSRPPPPGYPPDHYVSRGPPIPSHHPGFPPAHHRGYYPGTGPYPPGSHGPEVRLPPSDAYRHGRPTLFPPGHGPPPAGLPHSGVVSGHPTANYPRGIPREPMAGYYGPHPAHDVRGGGGGPPVPPPGPRQLGQPPPGHHAGVAGFGGYPPPYAFYGQPGAPNGGFMIQNLLQHPSAMAAAAAAAAAASGQASNGGIPGPPPPTTIEPVPVSSSANREQQ
ncbi:hypothetical protein HDE_14464 [Halotydeus destructor]|nr:hypothetical protein HDE_14464 [Halotydeus destructor]